MYVLIGNKAEYVYQAKSDYQPINPIVDPWPPDIKAYVGVWKTYQCFDKVYILVLSLDMKSTVASGAA